MKKPERILSIRLGALGDLVLCFQAFHEIRRAFPKIPTALLTMPAFEGFARLMPWFDAVIIDKRPSSWNWSQWLELRRNVRAFAPTKVYDLQGKARQSVLYGLLGGPLWGPQWSGAAPLCSHPRLWPPKPGMHFTDFIEAQLRLAGIPAAPPADLSWLNSPLNNFRLPEKFVLLIPSCAAGREYKRWPVEHYAALASRLAQKNIVSIAVGGPGDAPVVASIRAHSPYVVDFAGKTDLLQLSALMRRAVGVIGNDTGPTHLAAALGARTLALMSDRVNPIWSAPKGPRAKWLQGKPLSALSVDEVSLALNDMLDKNT
jgi:ADP-heptose:LPS heptosyltransferase